MLADAPCGGRLETELDHVQRLPLIIVDEVGQIPLADNREPRAHPRQSLPPARQADRQAQTLCSRCGEILGDEVTATATIDHFGQRYYDPSAARWIERDPIRHDTDIQQGNPFAYAGGDPVNSIDPSGELSFKTVLKGVSLVEDAAYSVAAVGAATVGTATCVGATAGVASVACAGIALSAGSAAAGGVYATYKEAKDL